MLSSSSSTGNTTPKSALIIVQAEKACVQANIHKVIKYYRPGSMPSEITKISVLGIFMTHCYKLMAHS
jgi:hypothetical protein